MMQLVSPLRVWKELQRLLAPLLLPQLWLGLAGKSTEEVLSFQPSKLYVSAHIRR
jgi:hypothetical protein